MNRWSAILALLLLAACSAADETDIELGPADGETPAEAPEEGKSPAGEPAAEAAPNAEGQRVTGTILPAERVKAVRVVDRAAGKSIPAVYDRKSGRFEVAGLAPGVWAVEIDTSWGMVQGVDMRFRPAELENRKPEKKPDEEPPPPLTDADRAEITRHVTGPERFMTARPLLFVGDGRRVTVLVDLFRDREYHQQKPGEIIWRLETWYYEKPWGTWDRISGTVIFRHRMSGATFRTWTRQFEPSLGGLEIAPHGSKSMTVTYTVPELPDRSRGPVAAGQASAEQGGATSEDVPEQCGDTKLLSP